MLHKVPCPQVNQRPKDYPVTTVAFVFRQTKRHAALATPAKGLRAVLNQTTPSRPINLFRRPSGKQSPAILDRLDAIQAEVDGLGLRRARDEASSKRYQQCLRAICLDLYVACCSDVELSIGVSRDNTALTRNSGYPDFVTPRQFLAALDGLMTSGYVSQVSLGTEASGQSTRIRATQKLYDQLSLSVEGRNSIVDATDPVRLKIGKQGGPKRPLAYANTVDTVRWRSNLNWINDINARFSVALDLDAIDILHMESLRLAKAQSKAEADRSPVDYQRIDFGRVSLHRVFNSPDWRDGGRFYGPWWQSVPRHFRKHITINEKHTCEHDYSSLHLRLLYAKVGAPVPNQEDPYSAPYGELHKLAVKRAFNVMLNSKGNPNQRTVPEFSSLGSGLIART